MTAAKPERILFDDDSIFDQNLTDKLLHDYSDVTWALKVTDELIFELTPAMRQEILEKKACSTEYTACTSRSGRRARMIMKSAL